MKEHVIYQVTFTSRDGLTGTHTMNGPLPRAVSKPLLGSSSFRRAQRTPEMRRYELDLSTVVERGYYGEAIYRESAP